MGLLERFRGVQPAANGSGRASLHRDAAAMRAALDALQREHGRERLGLRAALRDMLNGEIAAPTADIAALRDRGVDSDEFYEREIAPSWEGLDVDQRTSRLEGFLEMMSLLGGSGDLAGVSDDMAVNIRVKSLLIAWVYDQEYGYLNRMARGEDPLW